MTRRRCAARSATRGRPAATPASRGTRNATCRQGVPATAREQEESLGGAMANLSLIFAGISAASSIVQAVKSALETNRLLRKEDVLQIAAEAEQSALADRASAEEAAGELEGFDEEMEE